MKQITLTICAAALLFTSCNESAEKKDSTPTSDSTTTIVDLKSEQMPDSATMMKNWQMYSTPGDMHKMMASWDGTWSSEIKMWEQPGAAPTVTKGTAVNKMILGGRYQQSLNTATMMGIPFEGHGLLAYDNANKEFENIWVDNMGTGIMKMKGNYDTATKTMTLTGKSIDPGNLTEKDFKETFRIVNDNTQVMEMYAPGPDGKLSKMMEITYTRSKK